MSCIVSPSFMVTLVAMVCVYVLKYLLKVTPQCRSLHGNITIHSVASPWWHNTNNLNKMFGRQPNIYRTNSRIAPSQWETALLCNDVSQWLSPNLESALIYLNSFINSHSMSSSHKIVISCSGTVFVYVYVHSYGMTVWRLLISSQCWETSKNIEGWTTLTTRNSRHCQMHFLIVRLYHFDSKIYLCLCLDSRVMIY